MRARVVALRFAPFLGALVLAFAQVLAARADSASCLAKATSFIAELDELLEKEKYSSAPYTDLAERYFPFRACEAEALLDIARRSRFIRSISHFSRTDEYSVLFENNFVGAWFVYVVSERKSQSAGAGFTRKPQAEMTCLNESS
jgi:hypothetical protein